MVVYDAIAAAATLAGIEFDTTSRILRFGSVTPRLLEFSIPIMEDADVEMDESLTISLSDVRVNGVEITASPSFVTTRLRDRPLYVAQSAIGTSTIALRFSGPINTVSVNLFDGSDVADDVSDLELVGTQSGPVRGSLHWDAANNILTFVKSGGPLVADDYTLTLFSRADAFTTGASTTESPLTLLDGDLDGVAGGDFVAMFSVSDASSPLLSVGDIVRGPGQRANQIDSQGIPISIDQAAGIERIEFTFVYDSRFIALDANPIAIHPGLTDWTIDPIDASIEGQVRVTATGPALQGSGRVPLFEVNAVVQSNIPTEAWPTQLLRLVDVQVADSSGTAQEVRIDEGIHVAAYIGDTTGDRRYSALDSARIAEVVVHAGYSGFDAYHAIDPVLLADVTGNERISSLDAAWVQQKHTRGLPQIPDILSIVAPNIAAAKELAREAQDGMEPESERPLVDPMWLSNPVPPGGVPTKNHQVPSGLEPAPQVALLLAIEGWPELPSSRYDPDYRSLNGELDETDTRDLDSSWMETVDEAFADVI